MTFTQGFSSSNTFQLYDIIGWTNQAFKLFTPMICSDSIYTAIESKKDNPDIYLTLWKKIIGGAAVVKFQNKKQNMK